MPEARLRLSTRFYSRESIELAARTLARRGVFRLSAARGIVTIRVRAGDGEDAGRLAAELADEALNQECRRDLMGRNREVQRAVLAVMLFSARAHGRKRK